MRTIPFRSVLWAVAYKLGLDPKQSAFQDDQAQSIAEYVNEWVRKVYPSRQFPEWTFIDPFTPVNHIVTYIQDGVLKINAEAVFSVYLVDPDTTFLPVETDYQLMPPGIHCGFDHGTRVWVQYQNPPPEYTAEAWDGIRVYEDNEPTYSPISGECYKSKSSGNVGNDPAQGATIGNVVQTIQEFQAPSRPQITQVTLPVSSEVQPDGVYQLTFLDSSGVPHTVSYVAMPLDAPPQVLTGLMGEISTSSDPFFVGMATSLQNAGFMLKLTALKTFSVNFTGLLPGNPWWDPVLFPIAIADEVIMGVYGDTLKEWGQTQEGLVERQTVVAEADTAPATTQQPAKSRYSRV